MGACYSKNASDAISTPKNKAPKLKHKNSKKDRSRNSEEPASESLPLRGNQNGVEASDIIIKIDAIKTEASRSSTPDLEPEHFIEKLAGSGVAPSDSGIESIGLAPEEVIAQSQLMQERDELSKKLQRLSRGSCHKCGNFKLDDTALTALLADTYCLCGPRQAGRPSVNPQCQTHGTQKNKRTVSNSEYSSRDQNVRHHQAGSGNVVTNKNEVSFSNENSISGTPKKERSVRISARSAENLDIALTLLNSIESEKQGVSEVVIENESFMKAPLAQFDSTDTNLNDSPTLKSQKRKSLLSEILDITDSICRCDFYSNEYCSPHGDNPYGALLDAATDTNNKSSNTDDVNTNESPSYHANGPETVLNLCKAPSSPQNKPYSAFEDSISNSEKTADRFSSPSRKSASLPKNVSFATLEEEDGESTLKAKKSPTTKNAVIKEPLLNHKETSMSEASSGFFTHNSSSEVLQQNGFRDEHKRSASLGSRGAVLSDSSSEALDYGTEDDLASLDLDSLSRVTSLSYSSIRQLVESTEDLVSPLDTARRVTIDGVDCVIIPTETYRQMQADLGTLKQQLLCLSSLIQEEADGLSFHFGNNADTSMTVGM